MRSNADWTDANSWQTCIDVGKCTTAIAFSFSLFSWRLSLLSTLLASFPSSLSFSLVFSSPWVLSNLSFLSSAFYYILLLFPFFIPLSLLVFRWDFRLPFYLFFLLFYWLSIPVFPFSLFFFRFMFCYLSSSSILSFLSLLLLLWPLLVLIYSAWLHPTFSSLSPLPWLLSSRFFLHCLLLSSLFVSPAAFQRVLFPWFPLSSPNSLFVSRFLCNDIWEDAEERKRAVAEQEGMKTIASHLEGLFENAHRKDMRKGEKRLHMHINMLRTKHSKKKVEGSERSSSFFFIRMREYIITSSDALMWKELLLRGTISSRRRSGTTTPASTTWQERQRERCEKCVKEQEQGNQQYQKVAYPRGIRLGLEERRRYKNDTQAHEKQNGRRDYYTTETTTPTASSSGRSSPSSTKTHLTIWSSASRRLRTSGMSEFDTNLSTFNLFSVQSI